MYQFPGTSGYFPSTDTKWQTNLHCNQEQVESYSSPSSSCQCHNEDAAVWTSA